MKVGTIVRTHALDNPNVVVEAVVLTVNDKGCDLAAPHPIDRTLVPMYRYHDEMEVVTW